MQYPLHYLQDFNQDYLLGWETFLEIDEQIPRGIWGRPPGICLRRTLRNERYSESDFCGFWQLVDYHNTCFFLSLWT